MAKIKHRHQARAARDAMQEPGICLYVYNSNVFLEGQRYAENVKRKNRAAFRIHFQPFIKLATRARSIREAVWGGVSPRHRIPFGITCESEVSNLS